MSGAVTATGKPARERKHDFTGAASELRGILSREVRERWTHAHFLEVYGAFVRTERVQRLSRATRNWLSGMVDGAHTAVHAMTEPRHYLDGKWLRRDEVAAGSWEHISRTEMFWIGTEDMR